MAWRSTVRAATAAVALLASPWWAAPAGAEHEADTGFVYGGVGSEQEARSYPCPVAPAGGWERTGPVVCLAKRAPAWDLAWENDGYSCQSGPAGWSGTCLLDLDMGDHVKVWGTRGIPYTRFTLTWRHEAAGAGEPAATDAAATGGSPEPTTGPGAPAVAPRDGSATAAPARSGAPATSAGRAAGSVAGPGPGGVAAAEVDGGAGGAAGLDARAGAATPGPGESAHGAPRSTAPAVPVALLAGAGVFAAFAAAAALGRRRRRGAPGHAEPEG